MTKIIIIGGGVSGLTAGIYAQQAGFQSSIYERNALPGGCSHIGNGSRACSTIAYIGSRAPTTAPCSISYGKT